MTSPSLVPTTVEEQLDLVAAAIVDNTYARENPAFALVWVTMQNTPLAIENMSKDHMLMSIALWIKKEFVHRESYNFDLMYYSFFQGPDEVAEGYCHSYTDMPTLMEHSSAMNNTPPLRTMFERLTKMNALEELYLLIEIRAQEAREEVFSRPEYQLTRLPSLFF